MEVDSSIIIEGQLNCSLGEDQNMDDVVGSVIVHTLPRESDGIHSKHVNQSQRKNYKVTNELNEKKKKLNRRGGTWGCNRGDTICFGTDSFAKIYGCAI